MMQFEIYRTWGRWRWRLRAVNGEIIAQGQGYRHLPDCVHAIELIQGVSQNNSIVEYLSD